MRKYQIGTVAVILVVAIGIAVAAFTTADSSYGGQPSPDNPQFGCLDSGGCVDISSIPELCPEGRDEKGRPGCIMVLEGEELKWDAAERAQYVDWLREEPRRQRLEEEAGMPFPNLTGCPPVVDDPKNPPSGCTPALEGWPGGKPPTPHAIPYEPGRQREYEEQRKQLQRGANDSQ